MTFGIRKLERIIILFQLFHTINFVSTFLFHARFRPTVWETTDINIGAKNASNLNFAAIGNQVRFIDTIKYFQQSLANLAGSMNKVEKQDIKNTFERILQDRLTFVLREDRE